MIWTDFQYMVFAFFAAFGKDFIGFEFRNAVLVHSVKFLQEEIFHRKDMFLNFFYPF